MLEQARLICRIWTGHIKWNCHLRRLVGSRNKAGRSLMSEESATCVSVFGKNAVFRAKAKERVFSIRGSRQAH